MGMLRALVCAWVYRIVHGGFDRAGGGMVLGDEGRVGEGLDERWRGNEVCVAEGEGVREDAMDIDSFAEEDDGEGEGDIRQLPLPKRNPKCTRPSLRSSRTSYCAAGCRGILYGWSRMLGACSFLHFPFPPCFPPHSG